MANIFDKLTKSPRKIKLDTTYEEEVDGIDSSQDHLLSEDEYVEFIEAKDVVVRTSNYIPDASTLWQPCFPMASFREYQEATIENILKGWRSGKKYAVVEAITGAGKSALAITLARYFGQAFFATPQKMLQNQYMRDFPRFLYELKGRANYPCLRINHDLWTEDTGEFRFDEKKKKQVSITRPRLPVSGQDYLSLHDFNNLDEDHPFRKYHCANSPCITQKNGNEIKQECKQYDICEYIRRRDRALKDANFTLMNFSNLLLFSMFMPSIYRRRSLLILDEAHSLEHTLYDFAAITIKQNNLKLLKTFFDDIEDYNRVLRPFTSVEEFVLYVRDQVIPAYKKYEKSEKIRDTSVEETDAKDEFLSDMFNKDESVRLKNLISKLKSFLKENPTDHSHVLIQEKELKAAEDVITGITVKPFSVAKLGQQLAFNSSDSKVLLMSATILDAGTFCKSLGIPVEEAFFVRVPSTFPVKNRLIIGDLSVGSMTSFNKDKTWPKMMAKLKELGQKHEMHKGIIHTASHENMLKLSRWAQSEAPELYERLLFQEHGSYAEKEKLIKRHMETKENTILCGAGFSEGIDLRDDLARFNILIKVPMPSLGNTLVKRKAEEFPDWYALQTALTLIQALGRTVRSPTDWSWIYILDLYWKFFYNKNKNKLFPTYIQEAIRWTHGGDIFI